MIEVISFNVPSPCLQRIIHCRSYSNFLSHLKSLDRPWGSEVAHGFWYEKLPSSVPCCTLLERQLKSAYIALQETGSHRPWACEAPHPFVGHGGRILQIQDSYRDLPAKTEMLFLLQDRAKSGPSRKVASSVLTPLLVDNVLEDLTPLSDLGLPGEPFGIKWMNSSGS